MLEAHTANVEAFRRNEGPKLQKELVLPPTRPPPPSSTRRLSILPQMNHAETLSPTNTQIEASEGAGYPYSYIEKYWDDMYLQLRSPVSSPSPFLKRNFSFFRRPRFLLNRRNPAQICIKFVSEIPT